MADVAVDTEINDYKELYTNGIKASISRDFNTAASAFSQAIELVVVEHGGDHDSLGDIYLQYGIALLEISREEGEALGDAVTRELNSDSDEETNNATENSEVKFNNLKLEETVKDTVTQSDNAVKDETVLNEPTTSKSADEESTEEKLEEEPTDLQLAWEVLELAKLLFEKRGDVGRKQLAETLVVLGEVSLESENFESAIQDIKQGLEIQKSILKSDSRILAETYYKLAIALSTNNQIDEAVENFKTALFVLNNRVSKLKQNEENARDEIKEIEGLIPEIEEKIVDMKSFKEEATNKIVSTVTLKSATENNFEAGSSTKQASDISHLVKRKRKLEDITQELEENPSKKQAGI